VPKKIIITGGARGLGAAMVEKLAAEGHDIAFNYKSNAAAADALVKRLEGNGRKILPIQCDVSDYDDAGRFIQQAKEALGEVDALINNAGITRDKSLFIMAREEWQEVIDTNLNGYFNVTRHLIGYFMKNKRGAIVNISSVSGMSGVGGQANYCASKAGIIGFTKALAKETARLGIPVNCIAPGFIETDMTAAINPDHLAELKKRIPMQRFGKPEEVADLASFLISEKARYITGQVYTIDGGLTA
jgi:3-oxoacyl-[acyl-carrier protein] reductase